MPTYVRNIYEILEVTPKEHTERKSLESILHKLQEAQTYNHYLDEGESIRHTLEIERLIDGGCHALLDGNQQFIRHGKNLWHCVWFWYYGLLWFWWWKLHWEIILYFMSNENSSCSSFVNFTSKDGLRMIFKDCMLEIRVYHNTKKLFKSFSRCIETSECGASFSNRTSRED